MFTLPIAQLSIHDPVSEGSWDITLAIHNPAAIFNVGYVIDGMFFSSDGFKLYLVSETTDEINQYSLLTAWDPSTATDDLVPYNLYDNGGQAQAQSMCIDETGIHMYTAGNVPDEVCQHVLGTPWDLSTASYVNKIALTEETSINSVFVSSDGSKIYTCGHGTDFAYEYDLGTDWDITSAVYNSVSADLQPPEGSPQGMFFKPDGSQMWMVGMLTDIVYQYTLSTPWALSTLIKDSAEYVVTNKESGPTGVFLGDDGNKMYTCGLSHEVNQWDL